MAVSEPLIGWYCPICRTVTIHNMTRGGAPLSFRMPRINQPGDDNNIHTSDGLFLVQCRWLGCIVDPEKGTVTDPFKISESGNAFRANRSYIVIIEPSPGSSITVLDRDQGYVINKIPYSRSQVRCVFLKEHIVALFSIGNVSGVDSQDQTYYDSVNLLTGRMKSLAIQSHGWMKVRETVVDLEGFVNVCPQTTTDGPIVLQEYGYPELTKDRDSLRRYLFPIHQNKRRKIMYNTQNT